MEESEKFKYKKNFLMDSLTSFTKSGLSNDLLLFLSFTWCYFFSTTEEAVALCLYIQ